MNQTPPPSQEDPFEGYEELVKQYEEAEAAERALEKVEFAPFVEKLEALFIALLDEELLELLHAVKTKEEALNSKERERAKEALIPIVATLNFLKRRTNIPEEEFGKLQKKYKIISRAVGMINSGLVDHNR